MSNSIASNPKKRESTSNKDGPASTNTSFEFEPPLACIKRLLKNSLPSSTNVGKDASCAFARACGVFAIYVTTCANDFARENRRTTVTANDILAALKELDFDEFTPELTSFLEKHRSDEQSKKDAKKAIAASTTTPPPSKRIKTESSTTSNNDAAGDPPSTGKVLQLPTQKDDNDSQNDSQIDEDDDDDNDEEEEDEDEDSSDEDDGP